MPGRRPRAAWITALVTTTAAATVGLLTGTAAHAVVGDPAQDGAYPYLAKLDITMGDAKRSCTGTVVDDQWILTASSCFADDPQQGSTVAAGAPKGKTTATIGRTDLTGTTGAVVDVTQLVPRPDRDLVMARLAKPVTGIPALAITSTAPAGGDELTAVGYGRTKDEWVPNRPHTGAFTIDAPQNTTLAINAKPGTQAALCKGDTGAPLLRQTSSGGPELAAVATRSWQGGCLDSPETRTAALATRVDDLAAWIQQIRYSSTFAKAPWKYAQQMTAGYYTGGSAGGTRHMDLIVQWIDGEVTLYQGADGNDPARPFAAEYRLAPSKGAWAKAVSIDSANFTGGNTDGLIVRWDDGKLTQYTTVDAHGFHGEKQLAAPNATWKNARQMTVGRYTPGGRRDDLVVVWKDGETSLYTDLAANGVKRETQLAKPNTTWTYADQITSGEFAGKTTGDLLVRWKDGETTIYPGLTTKGLPGEMKIEKAKSAWANATVVAAGAFTTNTVPNDVLVRWNTGRLTLYPGVDATGLHDEIPLAP
ncbi:S1 family peptidase [Streptomyces sp. RPT161]|uniref:S1 family peptidase n=1 Tax=Streptomyces sp. RPT161 TaxID=3015993 RepID=UPI0022B8F857|nr:S1 family peptidase [Streptomyces sp. RPT161]